MFDFVTLPGGLRLAGERLTHVRSCTVGVWVRVGSMNELPEENGLSHFIEHMVFKGTQNRSARDIAEEMDLAGGQLNAFTSKECTCFYAKVVDDDLPLAIDVLADLVTAPKFDPVELEKEKGVVLEEIGMYEDTPEDLVSERLAAAVYKGSPLARPILGRASTLAPMTGEWLKTWQREHYRPGSIVVSLAGSFTQAQVDALCVRLGALESGPAPTTGPAAYRPAVTAKKKAIEQNHLLLAFPAPNYLDPRRYQIQLMNAIFGGGCSSRLFQEVREKRGLCYTTYSYVADHADTGLLGVYTALSPELEGEALDAACALLRELAEHGPTQEELERAREQAKASVLMGLESIQARMSHLGTSQLLYGSVLEQDDILDAYDAVTVPQLRQMAEQIFDFSQLSLSAVGRVPPAEEYAQLLSP